MASYQLPSHYWGYDESKARVSKGKKLGKKKIHQMASLLHCSSHLTEQAVNMYLQACDMLAMVPNEMKLCMATAAVYIVLRQNDWPISLSGIVDMGQCSVKGFNRFYKELLNKFNISIQTTPIEELVPEFVNRLDLDKDVGLRLQQLIPLCKDMWISSGRHHEPVLFAASYIAHESLHVKKKMTFLKFCKKYKIPSGAVGHRGKLVTEIKSTLILLTSGIPWLKHATVNDKTVVHHLQDILDYQKTLMSSCSLAAFEKDMSDENQKEATLVESCDSGNTGCLETMSKPSVSDKASATCSETESDLQFQGFAKVLPKTFKKYRTQQKRNRTEETVSTEVITVSTTNRDLDSEILNETDLTDLEMSEYIRNDDEVKRWKKARLKFGLDKT